MSDYNTAILTRLHHAAVLMCCGCAAGDMFYVIEDGSFTIYNERDGAELARVGKGSCFGELALLRQASHGTSALHVTCCLAWCRSQCICYAVARLVMAAYRAYSNRMTRPLSGDTRMNVPHLHDMAHCDAVLQDVRAASVRALTQATLLALHRDDFKRMLGNLQVIMSYSFAARLSGL